MVFVFDVPIDDFDRMGGDVTGGIIMGAALAGLALAGFVAVSFVLPGMAGLQGSYYATYEILANLVRVVSRIR